jgi:hypothetical protein
VEAAIGDVHERDDLCNAPCGNHISISVTAGGGRHSAHGQWGTFLEWASECHSDDGKVRSELLYKWAFENAISSSESER